MVIQKKARSGVQELPPSARRAGHPKLAYLIGLVVLLEGWLLVFFAATSLNSLEFVRSPVLDRWPGLLAPAKWLFPASDISGNDNPVHDWAHLLLLALVFFGAALTTTAAFYLAARIEQPERRHLLIVVGGAIIFGATLLFLSFFPSPDIYSYIFYGRLQVLHHANPLITVPSQFPSDPFFPLVLAGWRDTPSVYGPVWEGLAAGLTWLAQVWGGSLTAYILLFKGLSFLFHVGNVLLIWRILRVAGWSGRGRQGKGASDVIEKCGSFRRRSGTRPALPVELQLGPGTEPLAYLAQGRSPEDALPACQPTFFSRPLRLG